MSEVLTEIRDGILIITLNRPEAKKCREQGAGGRRCRPRWISWIVTPPCALASSRARVAPSAPAWI